MTKLTFSDAEISAVRRHAGGFLKNAGLPVDLRTLPTFRSACPEACEALESLAEVQRQLLDKITPDTDATTTASMREAADAIFRAFDHYETLPDPRRPMETRKAIPAEPRGPDPYPEERAIGYRGTAPFLGRRGLGLDEEPVGVSLGQFLRAAAVGPRTEEERSSLSGLTDGAGGYTIPAPLSRRLIDNLRAASVVNRAGATVVPMPEVGSLRIAAVASDPAVGWRPELGNIQVGSPTFRPVDLVAKSLATVVRISRELMADSVNLERQLPLLIARTMAAEIDRAALVGDPSGASGEPLGVFNVAGVPKIEPVDANGVVYSTDLIRLATLIDQANAGPASALIMAPVVYGQLSAQTDNQGQPLQSPPFLAGMPVLTTTNVPVDLGSGDDESLVFAGNWQHLLIGVREDINVTLLRERYADTGEYAFLAHARVDMAVEHPGAFAVLQEVDAESWPAMPVPNGD